MSERRVVDKESSQTIILRSKYVPIRSRLESEGFDPILEMIEIARDRENSVSVRRQATKDLLDKVFPDLKSVDVTSAETDEEEIKSLKTKMSALLVENKRDY